MALFDTQDRNTIAAPRGKRWPRVIIGLVLLALIAGVWGYIWWAWQRLPG